MYSVDELKELSGGAEIYLETYMKKHNKPIEIQYSGYYKKSTTSDDENLFVMRKRMLGVIPFGYSSYGLLWKAWKDKKSCLLEKVL